MYLSVTNEEPPTGAVCRRRRCMSAYVISPYIEPPGSDTATDPTDVTAGPFWRQRADRPAARMQGRSPFTSTTLTKTGTDADLVGSLRRSPHAKAAEPDDLHCLAIERDAGRQQLVQSPARCRTRRLRRRRRSMRPFGPWSRSPAPTYISISSPM
jgi:hypothetical protein